MTDKEYEEQKARVQKYFDLWAGPCGFLWWEIELAWNRNKDEDEPLEVAHTSVYWQYRTVKMTWNLPVVLEESDEGLEHIVVHELSHILVGSICDYTSQDRRELTEFAVSNVASALLYARKAKALSCKG